MKYAYRIDVIAGLVYGLRGKPFNASTDGYVHVPGKRGPVRAHRVIWEHVHGPVPAGMQINHINGIRSDNRIDNLELTTPAENVQHAYESLGRVGPEGERNGNARLTENDVRAIRKARLEGVSVDALAATYRLHPSHICNVTTGRSWSHVEGAISAPRPKLIPLPMIERGEIVMYEEKVA